MSEFEKWYVVTYFTVHGLVPPANLFNKYEDTYIHSDVYRHNLVWQQQQVKVEELQKRLEDALEEMELESLKLKEGYDGYTDPVGICQSEGIEIARKILEQALKGDHK